VNVALAISLVWAAGDWIKQGLRFVYDRSRNRRAVARPNIGALDNSGQRLLVSWVTIIFVVTVWSEFGFGQLPFSLVFLSSSGFRSQAVALLAIILIPVGVNSALRAIKGPNPSLTMRRFVGSTLLIVAFGVATAVLAGEAVSTPMEPSGTADAALLYTTNASTSASITIFYPAEAVWKRGQSHPARGLTGGSTYDLPSFVVETPHMIVEVTGKPGVIARYAIDVSGGLRMPWITHSGRVIKPSTSFNSIAGLLTPDHRGCQVPQGKKLPPPPKSKTFSNAVLVGTIKIGANGDGIEELGASQPTSLRRSVQTSDFLEFPSIGASVQPPSVHAATATETTCFVGSGVLHGSWIAPMSADVTIQDPTALGPQQAAPPDRTPTGEWSPSNGTWSKKVGATSSSSDGPEAPDVPTYPGFTTSYNYLISFPTTIFHDDPQLEARNSAELFAAALLGAAALTLLVGLFVDWPNTPEVLPPSGRVMSRGKPGLSERSRTTNRPSSRRAGRNVPPTTTGFGKSRHKRRR
jgi:hypothetical protein